MIKSNIPKALIEKAQSQGFWKKLKEDMSKEDFFWHSLIHETNGSVLKYVPDPTEVLIWHCLELDARNIQYLENPSDEFLRYALKRSLTGVLSVMGNRIPESALNTITVSSLDQVKIIREQYGDEAGDRAMYGYVSSNYIYEQQLRELPVEFAAKLALNNRYAIANYSDEFKSTVREHPKFQEWLKTDRHFILFINEPTEQEMWDATILWLTQKGNWPLGWTEFLKPELMTPKIVSLILKYINNAFMMKNCRAKNLDSFSDDCIAVMVDADPEHLRYYSKTISAKLQRKLVEKSIFNFTYMKAKYIDQKLIEDYYEAVKSKTVAKKLYAASKNDVIKMMLALRFNIRAPKSAFKTKKAVA